MLKPQIIFIQSHGLTVRQVLLLLATGGFFATSMTMKGGANLFLYLMFLLSIFQLGRPTCWYWCIFSSLVAPLFLTSLQLVIGLPVSLHAFDAPSRFLLAAMTLGGLSYVPPKWLAKACYGAIIGAIGVMIWGYLSTHYVRYAWGIDNGRGWNGFSNPIPFGSLSVLLGFIAFLLPNPAVQRKKKIFFVCLKIFSLIAGLVAGYFSGSRAILLVVIPGILFILAYCTKWPWVKVAGLTLFVVVILGSVVMSGQNRLSQRIKDGINDVVVHGKDQNTSMGLRFIMWRTAGQIVLDNPFYGVGKQGYFSEVNRRIKIGETSPLIKTAPHPHNELLNMGVEMGIPGLLIGFALYLVPGILFFRNLNEVDVYRRFAAYAGSLTVVAFFLIGLVDTYFWIVSQTAFYGVLVVVFVAILLSRDQTRTSL